MADEAIEEQELLNPVEETVQETETEDPEILKAKIVDLEEKNKQLYARVKKEPLKTNQSSAVTREDYERLELKTDGYKSDEVDVLMQNGGRKALENPIIMAGIESMRAKAKSTEATPSGTGKSYTYQKYGEKDLRKMSAEELEKIIPQD